MNQEPLRGRITDGKCTVSGHGHNHFGRLRGYVCELTAAMPQRGKKKARRIGKQEIIEQLQSTMEEN